MGRKNKKMKIILFVSTLSLLLIVAAVFHNNRSSFQKMIIKEIDKQYAQSSEIQIRIDELANFKWDKMIIFQAQTSREAINSTLGIDYNGSTDLKEGVIFVHNGEVVFEDTIGTSYDKSVRFRYSVNNSARGKNYAVFTSDNAVLFGRKINNTYVLSADPEIADR